ncbi:MAG TPA: hypothetical protein VKM55_08800 [Candidatus Lokiarchaeia archaeon]|nr:hypothetical protein [Candidatus Lokiarchaeia archaeon]
MKKIIFLGPPGAGKTTIRRFFFEGIPADLLMKRQEPPSIGLKHDNFEYLLMYPVEIEGKRPEQIPFQLTLLDTSGQELEKWFTTSRDDVFPGADIIFFIFDASDWNDDVKRQFVCDHVWFIFKTRNELAPDALFYILAHKFDKIAAKNVKIDATERHIREDLKDYIFRKKELIIDFNVHLTSLEKKYRNQTFSTLLELMTNSLHEIMT